jgi:hypothetical protein
MLVSLLLHDSSLGWLASHAFALLPALELEEVDGDRFASTPGRSKLETEPSFPTWTSLVSLPYTRA